MVLEVLEEPLELDPASEGPLLDVPAPFEDPVEPPDEPDPDPERESVR